jgi:hypothetical protein
MTPRTAPGARSTGGQGVVEYGLVLAGIALVATVLLLGFPDAVARGLALIAQAVARATR